MAYKITWYIEKRVIYQRLSGSLTVEEMERNNAETVQRLMEGAAPVHNIVDLREVVSFPTNLLKMSNAFKRDEAATAQLGYTVVLGLNPMFKFFGSVITQLWHTKFFVANTMDEALSMLRKEDKTLPQVAATD